MDDDDDDSQISQKNHRKKHNFAINMSKGGGIGVGVGIVLVGAAFLLNFFLNKPPKKPTNNNRSSSSAENHQISAENTDNGTEKAIGSGVSREISAHKLFEDGDHTFERSNGQVDRRLTCDNDDEEITSFSEKSENQDVDCNGSAVETDPLLHQLTREEADAQLASCIEVNGRLIDHGDQEKDSKADTPEHGEEKSASNAEILEENVCSHSEGSLNIKDETNGTFEADQGDEDKINIAIQTSGGKGTEGENGSETPCPEENIAQYDGRIDEIDLQDSNNGQLSASDARVFDENELLEEPKSGEEPKTLKLEEKEAEFEVETNAETEGIEENKARDSALYDTNGVGEAAETDSSIEYMSNVIEYRVIKEAIDDRNEKEIQHDVHTNAVREGAEIDSSIEHTAESVERQVIEEAIEDKEAQHDVHINAVREAAEIDSSNEHTTELAECQVIEEAIEDKEAQHDVLINAVREAAEIDSSNEHTTESVECQVIEEAIEDKQAQHDIHINAAAGEAVEIKSGSKKSSESIEIQTIPSHVSHQITTDNILPQAESSILQELNPTTGLKIDSKDVSIDLHSIEPVTEKDIIYQETDESSQEHLANPIPGENIEDGSQTLTADNVDEISEESLVQAKYQTDKLQDNKENVTLQKTEKEIHYKEIEDDDAISSENIRTVNIEKGVSNMNFLMRLTQHKNDDEKTSLLTRKRGPIVIGTMSALLWPVCCSCLIAVLAMVIYKIQGF